PEQLTNRHKTSTPPFPSSPPTPSGDVMRTPVSNHNDAAHSFGIMEVILQLSSSWSMALDYVKLCKISSESDRFPWDPASQYAQTTAALMDLGLKLPLIHRYRSIKISSLTDQLLEESRRYWGPWFLSRMMYHTIICILNHPLLLTLQIRGVHNVSEAFLQQTAFSISNHVSWIMHFIQLMKSKNFLPSDLFTIYCVGVVATIELQRSFSQEDQSSTKSKDNFEECVSFIDSLGKKWLCAKRLVNKLRCLEVDMSSWSRSNLLDKDDDILVDVSGILGILDFTSSFTEVPKSETLQDSTFGPSLHQNMVDMTSERPGYTRLPKMRPVDHDALSCHPPTPNSSLPPRPGQDTHGSGETAGREIEGTVLGGFTLPASEVFGGPFHDLCLWSDELRLPNFSLEL
ncbi:C6 transcription factor, partial [Fusarium albosuccineum]